jgi:tRNA pseudouridine38-40 synthase
VYEAGWEEWSPLGLEFRIAANRFLHHMVRYLVGTLVEIGLGRRPEADLARLISPEAPALQTSPPAPAEGLFLTEVGYREARTAADAPRSGAALDARSEP